MHHEVSILIPVFNHDIRLLASTLHRQCQDLGITFEILCADDGSDPAILALNHTILSLSHFRYEVLPQHLGRAAIRNKLARDARYPHLLLLDNDSQVTSPHFIRTYLEAAGITPVLLGGTCYQSERPPAAYMLRWLYGRAREERSATRRNQAPYQAFYLNNIFLTREIFLRFPLQPLLRGYGHEDSLFGYRLASACIPVRHLDNPVIHAGLEPAALFLDKSRQAAENLYWLYAREGVASDTRLVRAYETFKKWKLLAMFQVMYRIFERDIMENLQGPTPFLWLFDLFKLYHFCCQAQTKGVRPMYPWYIL